MKNKNLLIGGAVLIGIILYLRSRKTTSETRSQDAGGGLGGVGGGAMAQENGGGAVMQTSQPVVVSGGSTPSSSQGTLRPAPAPATSPRPLFSRPINVGGMTINPSTSPNRATGIMSGGLGLNAPVGTSRNFLTFDGNDEQGAGLDFGSNIID